MESVKETCSFDDMDWSIVPLDNLMAFADDGYAGAIDELEKRFGSVDKMAEADIVKFVPSKLEVERALSRLKILPNPPGEEEGDKIEMPWKQTPPITVNPNIWDKAELAIVNLEDLTATDTFLDRKRLKKHIKSMGQAVTQYRSAPLVIEREDELIIIDGHHRLMAQWLLGQETSSVWLAKEN